MSPRHVIKTVMSSAYASTEIFSPCLPMFIPFSWSSSGPNRGCKERAYKVILIGHPSLTALLIGIGPANAPLICMDAVASSYINLNGSISHALSPYAAKILNKYRCDMRSNAVQKCIERIQTGVQVISVCTTTSRSTDTASRIDFPCTEQYWPDVS